MAVIKRDKYGLYVYVGGYVARPNRETIFNEGDKQEAKHFRGSSLVGISKTDGRGKYVEHWITSGTSTDHKRGILKTIQEHHGH